MVTLGRNVIIAILLLSVIVIAGCTSSTSSQQLSQFEEYRQKAAPDTWTGICNLNENCKNLQKQCAKAFDTKDAFIIYDTRKNSITYGSADLWISGYTGNKCQDWLDWVMTASGSSISTPKEFVWQWAEDLQLIETFEIQEQKRESLLEKEAACKSCPGGGIYNDARCLNKTYYERCVEGVSGCFEWRNWTCGSGNVCQDGECVPDKELLKDYTWSVNDRGIGGDANFGTWIANVSSNSIRVYSKQNISGDYVKIEYVPNTLESAKTFEFDYDTSKTSSQAFTYFDIGYYNGQHKSISAGGKQGVYHIKFIFLSNRTINVEILEPDGNVGISSIVLDENDQIKFKITPYYRGSQFDFEYRNFEFS